MNYPDRIPGSFWGKVQSALGGKVDKIKGKGLSTEDYTPEDKEKVNSIIFISQADIEALFSTDSNKG